MAGRTDSGSSITNVAATAGVSIATVSRVLSGKRGKDDDIARRVREAAKQLGYSVNYAASALRSDVTKTIGLVIPSATEPFAAQLLDEIEPTIDTESQQLLLGIGATQEAQAERIESLANRHVDGLIVVPAAGADLAGSSRLSYPADVKIVRVPCSCRVNPMFVLKAFQRGADGVILCGCHPGDCHYVTGNYYTRRRMAMLFSFLDYLGIEKERTRVEWVSAAEGAKFSAVMNDFVKTVTELGENKRLADLRVKED